LKQGIQKTRAGLVDKVEDVLQGRKEIDAELLENSSTLSSRPTSASARPVRFSKASAREWTASR